MVGGKKYEIQKKSVLLLKVADGGLGGEKVLQLAVFGDRLKLSRPGQAWLGSAVLCLARPGSDGFSSV